MIRFHPQMPLCELGRAATLCGWQLIQDGRGGIVILPAQMPPTQTTVARKQTHQAQIIQFQKAP